MNVFRLLADLPQDLAEEQFQTLVESDAVRIERIVSRGHASPADGWYDQATHEWVLVLRGAARLAFDSGEEIALGPGDAVNLPAHTRHRVAWTDPEVETVWLAVHY